MFESVTSFFGGVGDFFHDRYEQASEFVHDVYDKVTSTTQSVVGTVYSDIKSTVAGGGHIIEKIADTSKSVIGDVVVKLTFGTNKREHQNIATAGVGKPINELVCRVSLLNLAKRKHEKMVIKNAK